MAALKKVCWSYSLKIGRSAAGNVWLGRGKLSEGGCPSKLIIKNYICITLNGRMNIQKVILSYESHIKKPVSGVSGFNQAVQPQKMVTRGLKFRI